MRYLCFFMALILTLGTVCVASADEEKELTAVELTRLMGNGINLGNTLEACDTSKRNFSTDPIDYETLWGQPETTQAMLRGMRDAGFSTIRIPVAWMTNATDLLNGDYTINPAYLDRVQQVVDWALDAGLYVIVNDHWDGGWYGMFGSESAETRAFAMEAYTGMWTQIATRFADYPDTLIFEGANEEIGARFDENSVFCRDSTTSYLTDNERYALANRVNQAFVDTVRACGGNNATRFLLIPGYGTNIDKTCDNRFVMPTDTTKDKLLISVHYYDPWSYCGASSAAGATAWGTQKDYNAMLSELSKMKKFTSAGYGVVIGEYGALPGSDNVMKDNAVAYHTAFLDCCDMLDYTSCLWDTSGFYVRRDLAFSDAAMGEMYLSRADGLTAADAKASFDAARDAAPERFNTDAIVLDDTRSVAWIMWNDGGWTLSYSVGDTYTPDSKSPGIVATDVEITGEGTYTIGLDFTGTQQGYSAGIAFAAIGIANGESLFPGYCINITKCEINGEVYRFKGRPYTTSDDGLCTRVNLFNEWVTKIDRTKARVPVGDLTGITATPINRSDSVISKIETIQITFTYGPRK